MDGFNVKFTGWRYKPSSRGGLIFSLIGEVECQECGKIMGEVAIYEAKDVISHTEQQSFGGFVTPTVNIPTNPEELAKRAYTALVHVESLSFFQAIGAWAEHAYEVHGYIPGGVVPEDLKRQAAKEKSIEAQLAIKAQERRSARELKARGAPDDNMEALINLIGKDTIAKLLAEKMNVVQEEKSTSSAGGEVEGGDGEGEASQDAESENDGST